MSRLMSFMDDSLSRQQMKAVRGGTIYCTCPSYSGIQSGKCSGPSVAKCQTYSCGGFGGGAKPSCIQK